jgi:hypothetical protein
MIRGLLRILLYVTVGPFVGSIGVAIAVGLSTFVATGSLRDFTGWEALLSPQLLIVSYSLGVVPALLTAIVGIVIDRQLRGWRHWLWSALSGAIISCILAWLTFGTAPVGAGLEPVIFTTAIGTAGALAGFVCPAMFDGLARLLGRR